MQNLSFSLQLALKQAVELYQAGDLSKTVALCEAILREKTDHFDVLHLLAIVQFRLGQLPNSVENYEKALAINPNNVHVLRNYGAALHKLRRFQEALASYDRALTIRPDLADVLTNRGVTLLVLGRFEDALASYDNALKIKPDNADAFYNRAAPLLKLHRFEEALTSYERALIINPGHSEALNKLALDALRSCDWRRTTALRKKIDAGTRESKPIIQPFTLVCYYDDGSSQRAGIETYVRHLMPPTLQPMCNGPPRYRQKKIRIAYVAGEFYQHATAFLITELFEIHDRSEFEVLAISYGPDDRSATRARVINAVDQFHDARSKTDYETARLIHDLEIDIAIDLSGHHLSGRPGILAHRPAPIQVNYLGFPGTMGADFIDYVIADKIVLPIEQQALFREKVVWLPECYQVNGSTREISVETPTRAQEGLPLSAFVFCCFNNSYKITPAVFDVWMRILGAVEDSVLWLLRWNSSAGIARQSESNLRKEAVARGIHPNRLVFSNLLQLTDHLARHRLADLFLDTLPYNAHTTASDALWAGLPLLTSMGNSFAGRVAASLLVSVGLPELITSDLSDYEKMAIKLATEPGLLQSLRQKLQRNRLSQPPFDTDRFRSRIEAAYRTMWEIALRGEGPRSFEIGSNFVSIR